MEYDSQCKTRLVYQVELHKAATHHGAQRAYM